MTILSNEGMRMVLMDLVYSILYVELGSPAYVDRTMTGSEGDCGREESRLCPGR